MPGEPRLDECKAQVLTTNGHARHQTSVAIRIAAIDTDRFSKHQRRRELLGPLSEILTTFRAIDSVETNSDRRAISQNSEGVTIGDTDHVASEKTGRSSGRAEAEAQQADEQTADATPTSQWKRDDEEYSFGPFSALPRTCLRCRSELRRCERAIRHNLRPEVV